MNAGARAVIAALRLAPLPGEGGFFRVTRRTRRGSAILYLITRDDFSAWHRIAQDELWHFHAGDAIEHLQIDARRGRVVCARLGAAVRAGELPQAFVPAGTWQAARIAPARRRGGRAVRHGFALLGCTVTPPWRATGFELGRRAALTRRWPEEAALIAALTR